MKDALKKHVLGEKRKGTLKIFLGYAPGVGKTYTMLNEANRLLERNTDVVVGYIETHGRNETEKQIYSLEVIPRKKIKCTDNVIEEIDTSAIINRCPEIVLIDDLAHTNAPGSINNKRYEDIQEILDHGISVLTTLNIQHLESLNDIIMQITGIKVKETIPDKILDMASEIVVVDVTPETLQDRLKRGYIYKEDFIEKALKNFFRKGNLNALREITLRKAAEDVDDELEEYMKEHGIEDNWHTVERVMVCITSGCSAKEYIRRGARIAKRNKCQLIVVYVKCTHFLAPKLTEKDLCNLENHYKLAKQLGAKIVNLEGKSVSLELSKFCTANHITQIIIGHSNRNIVETIVRGSTVEKLLKFAKDVEIHVIPEDE